MELIFPDGKSGRKSSEKTHQNAHAGGLEGRKGCEGYYVEIAIFNLDVMRQNLGGVFLNNIYFLRVKVKISEFPY